MSEASFRTAAARSPRWVVQDPSQQQPNGHSGTSCEMIDWSKVESRGLGHRQEEHERRPTSSLGFALGQMRALLISLSSPRFFSPDHNTPSLAKLSLHHAQSKLDISYRAASIDTLTRKTMQYNREHVNGRLAMRAAGRETFLTEAILSSAMFSPTTRNLSP
jgi:hypothetical protein